VRARLLLIVSGLAATGVSKSEPLSITPFVGVKAEYSSNPFLLANAHAANDAALLLNAPTNYDLDAAHFALNPRIRYSDSGTYASLQSNSLHVDASAQFLSDLDSLSLIGGVGRDSSLYSSGLASNGAGVRADSTSAAASWQRTITPRFSFELDPSWQKVRYADSGRSGLADYANVGITPSLQYLLTERDTLSVLASGGEYKTSNGLTESKSVNLQLSLDHRLTEIWTLSASGGYSIARNSFNLFLISGREITLTSDQKGPVYKASIVRKGEQLDFSLGVSRAFIPSGFAFLSQQNAVSVGTNYTASQRWGFAASGSYLRTQDPLTSGGTTARTFFLGDVAATWHWTEVWAVTFEAKRESTKYAAFQVTTASTTVSIEISRQFPRMDL
jgi:hypothetical protein